ncbi:MAG TPA: Uma2 family endonuclease [Phototrophicaceae bacterium]|nr:Uma2 family endonuclease [Phototrophicaceae bacterium]
MTDVVRVSAAEFDQLTANDERRFELINGEVIEMTAPKIKHQRLIGRLYRLLDDIKPDGEVFITPDVYLDEYNVPEPDIVWVAANSATCEITENRLIGAPDLVVEILSPSTAKRDRTDKFDLYEKHGTREYWLVDPEYDQIEVWKRGATSFERQRVYGIGDTFESAVLGGKTVEIAPIFA